MDKSLTLRQFDIAEASWKSDEIALKRVRRLVFIIEQKIPPDEEWDGLDEEAWHWLATDRDGEGVGTGRLLASGQIGRMAVLAEYRGIGIGAALLEQIMVKAARLGMQSVFVHAQREAEPFYARSGFLPEGAEFEEAGIPHIRMTRALEPFDYRQEEIPPRPEPVATELKQFDTREADWVADAKPLRSIRERVFIREQGVPAEIEQDGRDEEAYHWLAEDFEGIPLGTARLLPDGQIGRMAVLAEYRGRGIGFTLLELAIQKARWLELPEVFLHAQLDAEQFYVKAGFVRRGDEFVEAGIRHVEMVREIEPLEPPQPGRRVEEREELRSGVEMPEASLDGMVLGETNQLIVVRREEACRELSLALARQARLRLRIYSPWLDHALYDNPEFNDAVSRLARRNRHTEIQILIWNSHRMVKNGHALLELSRRLSSSIRIRCVHADYRQLNHEYILADDEGIIYRQEFELYEGYANFYDKTEVNRLGREFLIAWETSYEDPNLRQLKI